MSIDIEKVAPVLRRMGVYIDKYSFAWIKKKDHYFRVNLENAQVFFFSRIFPGRQCRICLVQTTSGKDFNLDANLEPPEMLLLSIVAALQYDLLPGEVSSQIDAYHYMHIFGRNMYDFDPVAVFHREYKDLHPELYKQYIEERRKVDPTYDPEKVETFTSLRDEMMAELVRLKRLLFGTAEIAAEET